MAYAQSACSVVGPCVLTAFDTVYKAAKNYPKETFRVSNAAFKAMNVSGALLLFGLNLGSQALGWRWTQKAYEKGLLKEEAEKSAGHKYVPFMLATGAVSLIQTTTSLVAGSSFENLDPSYPAALNASVSTIMTNASCDPSRCAAKIGETLFNCTLNYFFESFKQSKEFNAAAWINSDTASALYQIGGVNMIASSLILGFNVFQALSEVKTTKVINPATVAACCFAAIMFLNGLVEVYYGSKLPFEENTLRQWKNCEVIS